MEKADAIGGWMDRGKRRIGLLLLSLAAALVMTACAQPSENTTGVSAALRYSPQVINPHLTGGLRLPPANVVLLWGSDGSILRSEDGTHWDYAVTPVSTDLTRIATDPVGDVAIAVGESGVILRSEDAGRHWQSVTHEATDTDLKAIVFHPPSSTWIAAGTHGRILRSSDTGKSWSIVSSPLTLTFEVLAIDPVRQSLLIGGEAGVVGMSTDAGATWNLTWIHMPEPATPITGFFRQGNTLLATSALGRFLLSDDDAQSWNLMQSMTRAFFTGVAFDPIREAIVMIGHDGTVLRSSDAGHTWQTDTLAFQSGPRYLSAIRFDETTRSLLVSGHGGTLARSFDGGAQWERASSDVAGNLEGLVQGAGSQLVTFGNGGLVMTSDDAGAHWRTAKENLDLYLRDVATLADAVVATGQLGGIIRSRNGIDWQAVAIEYPDKRTPPDLRAMTQSSSGNAMIAAGPPGAILRSSAAGDRWDLLRWKPLEAGRAYPWILSDRSRKVLVTVDAHGAMQVSHDDGVEWHEIDSQTSGEFWHGAVLERDGVMIIAGKSGSVARSDDSGQRWTQVTSATDADLFGSYADEVSRSFFLMGDGGVLLRSLDTGRTWQPLQSGTAKPLRRMVRDARFKTLIAFGGGGAIVRSDDGGETWHSISSGVDAELRKAIVEPDTGNILIAGRAGVLLRSADGGKTWEQLATHTTRNLTSVTARSNGDLIAVGERVVHLKRQSAP